MAQSVVIDIDAGTKQFERALDDLSSKVRSTASQMDKAFSFSGNAEKSIRNTSQAVGELHLGLKNISIIAAGNVLADGFQKAYANIRKIGSEIYSTTERMQGLEMSMKSIVSSDLIKSGKAADYTEAMKQAEQGTEELMAWFKKLSLVSPYEYTEVIEAFKQNANMGQTVEQAKVTTKAILELGSGLGMTQNAMKRFSVALAQTGATGKITASDLRQFANAGFGMDKFNAVFGMLSEKYGILIQDHNDFNNAVKEGKLTTDDFFNALGEYAETNYGGAVEAMASTIGGLKSSLADIKTNAINDLFLEASKTVSRTLKPYIEYLMELLTSGNFTKWGKELNKWALKSLQPVQKIGKILENGDMSRAVSNLRAFFSGKTLNTGALHAALEEIGGEKFADSWISRLDTIKGLVDRFIDGKDTIIGAVKGIGTAFAGAFAVNKVTGLIQTLASINPSLMALTAAGAAFGIAWEKNLFGLQDKVKGFVANTKSYIGSLKSVYEEKGLSGVWEKLKSDGIAAISQLPARFDEALTRIGTYISAHKDAWLARAKEKTLDIVGTVFGEGAEEQMKVFVETTVPAKIRAYKDAWESEGLSGVWTQFSADANTELDRITGYIDAHKAAWGQNALNLIGTLFGENAESTVLEFFAGLSKKLEELKEKLTPVKEILSQTFSETFKGTVEAIKDSVEKIKEKFDSGTWKRFGDTVREIGRFLAGILLLIADLELGSIDGLVRGIGDGLANVLTIGQSLAATLSDLWELIKDVAAGDWDAAGIKLENLGASLENLGESIVNAVKDGIQAAIDVLVDMFFDAYAAVARVVPGMDESKAVAAKTRYDERREAERKGIAYVDTSAFQEFDRSFWAAIEDGYDGSIGNYIRGYELSHDKVSNELLEWLTRERAGKDGYYDGIEDFYKSRFLDQFLPGFEQSGEALLDYARQMGLTAQQQKFVEDLRAETYELEVQHWLESPKSVGDLLDPELLSEYYRSTPFGVKDDFVTYKRNAFDYAYSGLFSPVLQEAAAAAEAVENEIRGAAENAGQTAEEVTETLKTTADTMEDTASAAWTGTADHVEEIISAYFSDTASVEKDAMELVGTASESLAEAAETLFSAGIVSPDKRNGGLFDESIMADAADKFTDHAGRVAISVELLDDSLSVLPETMAEAADGLSKEALQKVSDSIYTGREVQPLIDNLEPVQPVRIANPRGALFDESTMTGDPSRMYAYASRAFHAALDDTSALVKELAGTGPVSGLQDDYAYLSAMWKSEKADKDAAYESKSFINAAVSAIQTSGIPESVAGPFLSILEHEGTNRELAISTMEILTGVLEESGAIVGEAAAAVAESETSVFGDDFSKEYLYALSGEYEKYLAGREQEILSEMGMTALEAYTEANSKDKETAEAYAEKRAEALEKLGIAMEKWYRESRQVQEDPQITGSLLNTFMANMGTTLDGLKEVTADNWLEAKEFLTSMDTWESFADSVAFGGREITEEYITGTLETLLPKMGQSGEFTEEFLTGMQTTMADMTSEQKMSWLKFLVSGLNTNIEGFAKANDENLKAIDTSVNKANGSTATGNAAVDKFKEVLKNYNTAAGTEKDLLGYELQAILDATGLGKGQYSWNAAEGRFTLADLTGENGQKVYESVLSNLYANGMSNEIFESSFKGLTDAYFRKLEEYTRQDTFMDSVFGKYGEGTAGGTEEQTTGSGGILSLLFGNPEMYQGLADVLTPDVMTALQTLITTELNADPWTLFAQSLQTVSDSFANMSAILKGGDEGEGLSTLLDNVLQKATTVSGYFSGELSGSIDMLMSKLALTGTDENGEENAAGGNTLYTTWGWIYKLMLDTYSISMYLAAYWRSELPSAVDKLKKAAGDAIGVLQEMYSAAESTAQGYRDIVSAIMEVIQSLQDLDKANGGEGTVGEGGSGSEGAMIAKKIPGHAGGGTIFPYGTAIVGEHGPEIIRAGSSRLNVFANSQLMGEIANIRHAFNGLANSAEAVAYNRIMNGTTNSSNTDNSQHFENNFNGLMIGERQMKEMIEDTVRETWRKEMRLAS